MKKVIISAVAILFTVISTNAQDIVLSPTVISSAGGYAETSDLKLSWTLGELAVTTLTGDNIILTQGFHQGFLPGTGFKLNPIEWNVNAYPNPVINELKIQFNMPDPNDFLVDIQDVSGRLLSQLQYKDILPGDLITLNMSEFRSGIYFIRISTTNREQVRVLSINKE